MNEHLKNDNIYIRSFASRGKYGGLSSAIYDVLLILSSFGCDFILVETVGIGQNEIEISNVSDVTVLVLDPLSGDSIQAMKAGVMEIADIYTINKNDVMPTTIVEKNIQQILGDKSRNPKVISSNSQNLEGIELLYKTIHRTILEFQQNKSIENKRKIRFENHIKTILESEVMDYIINEFAINYQKNDSIVNPYEITEPFLEKHLRSRI